MKFVCVLDLKYVAVLRVLSYIVLNVIVMAERTRYSVRDVGWLWKVYMQYQCE